MFLDKDGAATWSSRDKVKLGRGVIYFSGFLSVRFTLEILEFLWIIEIVLVGLGALLSKLR